jgi:serine protease AprX
MIFSKNWLLVRLFFLLCFFVSVSVQAQDKYWVVLKDKKGVAFDPLKYFDAKALERRIQQHLPISDETDKPLNPQYFQEVKSIVDSVSGSSRWLNAMSCFAKPNQLEKLRNLPFVKEIIPFSTSRIQPASYSSEKIRTKLSETDQGILQNQLLSLGAAEFQNKKLNGKGIRIAVLDVGFKSVDTNPAFNHLRQEKRILKTWDFVKNYENVYHHASHGTEVLSCIGGILDGKPVGLATEAEFLLARVERMHSEKFSEEEFWLAAMEWADKNGADIINSSLGFTNDRYFREQMDGRTPMVARAANLAARKGMLVVNANGNDGTTDSWKIIGTPADADSVLSVGGISADQLFHADFSSYGPTADKRMKPNVVAFGDVVAAGEKGFGFTQGTSFASPLIAGFAACAWQANRKLTNMQLFEAIEKAGHLYPYFDYAHGYGVPQATKILGTKSNNVPTFDFMIRKDSVTVKIKPEFFPGPDTKEKPASELPVSFNNKPYLYYHLADKRNVLKKYFVLEVSEPNVFSIPVADFIKGTKLRVHYQGYSAEYTF